MESVVSKTPEQFAKEITEEYQFVTYRETEEILLYKDGVYLPYAESLIKEIIENKYADCSTHYCNEVIGHIQRKTYRFRHEFDADAFIINAKNGLLDIRTGVVEAHRPDYLSRIQIPVVYDPNAKCRRFLQFLKEVQPDAQDRRILLEQFAYSLWRDSSFHKAFMHIGRGANGKSTFFAVMERFLGKQNVANQSLHNLGNNRFSAAELDAKLANIYADISDQELKHAGLIKILISGDPITVEKKHKAPFKLEPFCKLYFSCNKLPEVQDDSDAFFRRWHITEWKRKFEGKKADTELIVKLTTDKELSGILNILIIILKHLIQRRSFSNSPSTEQVKKEWLEKADLIGTFLNENVITEAHGWVVRTELYERYVQWSLVHSYVARGIKTFNERLQSKLPVRDGVIKPGGRSGKSVRVWRGIAFKDVGSTQTTGSTNASTYMTLANTDVA